MPRFDPDFTHRLLCFVGESLSHVSNEFGSKFKKFININLKIDMFEKD